MHYNSREPYIVDPHTAVGLTAATIVAPYKCVYLALNPNYNSQKLILLQFAAHHKQFK